MTQLYVATTGNDTTGNGTSGNPYATILKASTVAAAGDTINVASGNYSGSFQTTQAGTSGNPITYVSTTKWGAKLIPPASSPNQYAWDCRGAYSVIDGFESDG